MNKTDPAFPFNYEVNGIEWQHQGLSIRLYVATAALQGMLAAATPFMQLSEEEKKMTVADIAAERCLVFADALISKADKPS